MTPGIGAIACRSTATIFAASFSLLSPDLQQLITNSYLLLLVFKMTHFSCKNSANSAFVNDGVYVRAYTYNYINNYCPNDKD